MRVRTPEAMERAKKMADAYRSGRTLQDIGTEHGVTRERVRQIIGWLGMDSSSGGKHQQAILRAQRKHQEKLAKREAFYQRNLGCTRAEYVDLIGSEFTWSVSQRYGKNKSPGAAYAAQKINSRKRGIEWRITFSEWWHIWQESGKWSQRGRGGGYCMARLGDSGPYAPGNVYICTIGQNFSDSYLVHPWHKRFPEKKRMEIAASRKYLGYSICEHGKSKRNPFQLVMGKKYIGLFPTWESAEQAALKLKAAA